MAVVTQVLWAKQGNIKFPGGVEVPFWGFAGSAGGPPQLPGPLISAQVGDVIRIVLHNNLNDFVSMIFPGQDIIPEPFKNNGVIVSYNTHASPGGTVTYTFEAKRPGIFLYESGTRSERQVPMGLYGAMVIYPAGVDKPYDPDYKTAYGRNTGTRFDIEKILVFSEVDTRFNLAMGTGNPFNMLDFEPDYWLINGRSYPYTLLPDNTDFLAGQPLNSKVDAAPEQRILLRCINAGTQNHTFRLEGIVARVMAVDAWPLWPGPQSVNTTYLKNTITIASGESYDILFTVGAKGQYYLHDRDHHHFCNADHFPGGMATRLDIGSSLPNTVPKSPENLTCSLYCGNGVGLSWDRGTGEEGYVVERRTGTGEFEAIAALTVSGIQEYTDNTVLPNSDYSYRIRAYNFKGFSGYSNLCSLSTHNIIAGPTDLTCYAVSSNQVDLAWINNAYNEDGYLIERKTAGTGRYQVIATVPVDTMSYQDTTVTANAGYYYRVRAYNSTGFSCYSNECGVITPGTAIPVPPGNLTATAAPIRQVILNWVDNGINEVGFKVERRIGAGTYTLIAVLGSDTTTYTDENTPAQVKLYYRVKSYNSSGDSDYSNEAMVEIPEPPTTPTRLRATVLSATEIKLTWKDTAGNEEFYHIERSTRYNGVFGEIAKVSANTAEYIDNGLQSDTSYFYRIRSSNAGGYSEYSYVLAVST